MIIYRVGKSCLIKKFTKGSFKELYNETVGTDLTNKIVTLKENNNKEIPFQKITNLKLQLFDSPGKVAATSINTKFFSDMKALFILFDLTDEESFKGVRNYISISQTFFEICKKNKIESENDIIKQPNSFKDMPIIILGNKVDLGKARKILIAEIKEEIENLKKEKNFTKLTYHEISVKDDIGIEKIFQEAIFYYLKRNFEPIVYKGKNHPGGSDSLNGSEKDLVKVNNNNIINNENNKDEKDDSGKNLVLEIKEDKKEKKKRVFMDKSVVIFYQMIDKVKKQFFSQIESLKEENRNEIEKLNNDYNEKINQLNEKINIIENKNNELEKQIDEKNQEIKNLMKKIGNNYKSEDIFLKFKIPDKKFTNEIIIKTKGENRMSEVINSLYELCPYIYNLKIKNFCLNGNKKIDEMKTVNENELTDNSLIYLII